MTDNQVATLHFIGVVFALAVANLIIKVFIG